MAFQEAELWHVLGLSQLLPNPPIPCLFFCLPITLRVQLWGFCSLVEQDGALRQPCPHPRVVSDTTPRCFCFLSWACLLGSQSTLTKQGFLLGWLEGLGHCTTAGVRLLGSEVRK